MHMHEHVCVRTITKSTIPIEYNVQHACIHAWYILGSYVKKLICHYSVEKLINNKN